MNLIIENCRINHLSHLFDFSPIVDVLRLDLVHPTISGNKWFKLKKYLADAKLLDKKILLTFGGAYSNHIVATAAAAQTNGLKSIGIVRGERPNQLSHTLVSAMEFGMELYFILREAYKEKIIPEEVYTKYPYNDIYQIPEGGYGEKGMMGAMDILLQNNTADYNYFILAAGTGTTTAGLANAASAEQKIIAVSALKNNYSLQQEIEALLPETKHLQFELDHSYSFGGYAKLTEQLTEFMNNFYLKTGIATDLVYTGKAFYAAFDLLNKGYFKSSDKLLLIHTGGLQGNKSLQKGTLIFH